MIHVIVIFSSLISSFAVRLVKRRDDSSVFNTRTDANTGTCAAHIQKKVLQLPISFPLLCTSGVTGLTLRVRATTALASRLRLSIDGVGKDSYKFPWGLPWSPKVTRTWEVSHGSLAAGLHTVFYSGDFLRLHYVEVEGSGGSCSFSEAPGYNPGAFTNSGMDVISRVVGAPSSFPTAQKQQLHFAHETLGKNSDGSISATAVSNGVWEWFYMYSQEQNAKDEWLSRKLRDGDMYEESDIQPFLKVALDQLPGRSGDAMEVCEPCNTLSNIMFMEATVFSSCKSLPVSSDEFATLLTGFSAMGAGSAFFHASATRAGQLADVFGMQMVMYQMHQLAVKGVLAQTRSSLTQTERNNIMYLDSSAGPASSKARELTRVFRTPYNRTGWMEVIGNLGMPSYELSIVGIVLTVVETLRGNWLIPGLEGQVDKVIDALMDALKGGDVEWAKATFLPNIKKAFSGAKFCGDRLQLIERFLKFVLTFVEAFMFQEKQIDPPQALRDIFNTLDKLGITGALADMRVTWDIYNGEASMCHQRSEHATWHEKAAHGLMHMQNLAALMITDVKGSC